MVGRNIGVLGFYLGRLMRLRPDVVAAATSELVEMWTDGAIRPVIGAEFELSSVSQALDLLESRRSTGKVVLHV
jgi:NADPH2:quinone reductase